MRELTKRLIAISVRQKRLIFYLALSMIVASVLLFSDFGYITKIKLKNEKNELNLSIKQQEKLKDSLEKRINLITFDYTEIERIARFNYGMIRQGEKVFVIRKN